MNIASSGDSEHRGVLPQRRCAADQRADEQADHLVRLELREALRAPLRGAEIGQRGAQRGDVRAGARAHHDAERGEHRQRPDVEEQEDRQDRVDEARADQERLAAPAIAEASGGHLDERVRDERPGDEDATAIEFPPRWAT